MAIVGIITVAVILLFAKELDVLLLGDDVAETLGVDTRKTKLLIIITATILTGVVVSVSGVIGFVGLVVPHIMRSFVAALWILSLVLWIRNIQKLRLIVNFIMRSCNLMWIRKKNY